MRGCYFIFAYLKFVILWRLSRDNTLKWRYRLNIRTDYFNINMPNYEHVKERETDIQVD